MDHGSGLSGHERAILMLMACCLDSININPKIFLCATICSFVSLNELYVLKEIFSQRSMKQDSFPYGCDIHNYFEGILSYLCFAKQIFLQIVMGSCTRGKAKQGI